MVSCKGCCTVALFSILVLIFAWLFLQVDDKQAPFMCLDLSFCHSLITQGFKIAENSKITLVKRIQYKNEEVEAAWPLGAAINMLNN